MSRLLGRSLSPGPGRPHHRRHWRTGNTQKEKSQGIIERRKRRRREAGICQGFFLHHLFVFISPLLHNRVCVCLLSQVSALYFTSAQISLFERLCLRTDSDSADIILWDELVKGKHRACYTVTHQAHMPAWVRKGRTYKRTHTKKFKCTRACLYWNIVIVSLTLCCPVSTQTPLFTHVLFHIVCK